MQYIVGRRLKTNVIVVTQHTSFSTTDIPDVNSIQELDRLLSDGFPDIYRGVVHVVLGGERWKGDLARAVARCFDDQC